VFFLVVSLSPRLLVSSSDPLVVRLITHFVIH
jgi:hypothetical protein